ncbi:MAG: MFS transporter [Clostridia bacterium]
MNNWKQKITVIWIGQSISILTSSVLQMALIWYITATTGSAMMVTLATIAGFLPHALIGTFAGVFIDRYSKKLIVILSDLFISFICVILALFSFTGNLPVWLIIILLAFRSIGTAFHEPTAQALIPLFVPDESLTKFAGFAQAFESLSLILSPSIAIVLYEIWDLHYIILLDVIGALVAVSLILIVKFPKQKPSIHKHEKINIIKETKEGLKVLSTYPGMLTLVLVGMLYTVCYSPVGSLYPHITMNYFGGSTAQSGFVEIVFSIGSLLGALVLGIIGGRLPKTWGLMGSIFIYGLGICIIGCLSPNLYWVFVIISLFVGFTIPFYHGIQRSIFQLTIPEEYLGRAFALAQSSKRLGMPIGLLFGGLFADVVGVNILYIIAGFLAMILALTLTQNKSLKNLKNTK